MKSHRRKVVDDGPGDEDGNDEHGGAGDPPPLVEVALDLEHRDAVEEGQQEEGAGVEVKEEEAVGADGAFRVTLDQPHAQAGR